MRDLGTWAGLIIPRWAAEKIAALHGGSVVLSNDLVWVFIRKES